MATATSTARPGRTDGEYTLVDPRAPRFGQAITAAGLLLGIALQAPAFVFAIGLILNTAVWSRWRVHPYSLAWRHVIGPALDAPDEPEPAAPHRFATLIGAVGTLAASALLLTGFPLAAYVIAGAIAAAAGLGATTGFCLGCHMYRSVSLFRRLSIV
ncbi:MAG: DUF4395 domain-containing protein [Halobacteriales archaeon]|nr:DUF4395 domain-containing protein [Halobacteriales archaeon]